MALKENKIRKKNFTFFQVEIHGTFMELFWTRNYLNYLSELFSRVGSFSSENCPIVQKLSFFILHNGFEPLAIKEYRSKIHNTLIWDNRKNNLSDRGKKFDFFHLKFRSPFEYCFNKNELVRIFIFLKW